MGCTRYCESAETELVSRAGWNPDSVAWCEVLKDIGKEGLRHGEGCPSSTAVNGNNALDGLDTWALDQD